MKKKLPLGRIVTIFSACTVMAVATFGISGCDWLSGDDAQNATPTTPVTAGSKIEPIEGMRYYVGGPVMRQDQYGRMRVKSFNGEIKKPTARGLVIGYKELEGDRFELRTWLNGDPVSEQRGFVDGEGLFWYDERSTIGPEGVVIVRQTLTHDDDAKIIHSVVEHLDPTDGEVVSMYETDLPYSPPDVNMEDEEEEADAADDSEDE
jgi:hypothetical protein